MAWLDSRFRCNRCGTPFADGCPSTCTGCGADLTTVGTQNELRDWGVTRRQGRRRFVWVRCVLAFGVPMAVAAAAATAYARWVKGSTEWAGLDYLYWGIKWLVVWWVLGHLRWRGAEREYAAWARAAGQRPAESGDTPDPAARIGSGSS